MFCLKRRLNFARDLGLGGHHAVKYLWFSIKVVCITSNLEFDEYDVRRGNTSYHHDKISRFSLQSFGKNLTLCLLKRLSWYRRFYLFIRRKPIKIIIWAGICTADFFGFVHGTFLKIAWPHKNQQIMYSYHKSVHEKKF